MSVFRPEEETKVRELLDALDRPVELLVALGPEETPLPGARDMDFGAETVRIVEEVARLSDKVSARVEEEPPRVAEGGPVSRPGVGGLAAGASSRRFERYPAIAVLPDGEDVGIRYYGLPWGYELASLIGGVLEAGKAESSLTRESLERLAALEQDLAIDVFVTPT
jgi:alkyl hydroperoxide reductase subunit AhpF